MYGPDHLLLLSCWCCAPPSRVVRGRSPCVCVFKLPWPSKLLSKLLLACWCCAQEYIGETKGAMDPDGEQASDMIAEAKSQLPPAAKSTLPPAAARRQQSMECRILLSRNRSPVALMPAGRCNDVSGYGRRAGVRQGDAEGRRGAWAPVQHREALRTRLHFLCTFFALQHVRSPGALEPEPPTLCTTRAVPPNALHGCISPHSMSFVSRGLTFRSLNSNTSCDRVCVFCRTARRGPSSSSLGSTCSPTLRRHSTRWARNGVLTDVDATRSDDVDATITVPITSDIASPRFRDCNAMNDSSMEWP